MLHMRWAPHRDNGSVSPVLALKPHSSVFLHMPLVSLKLLPIYQSPGGYFQAGESVWGFFKRTKGFEPPCVSLDRVLTDFHYQML